MFRNLFKAIGTVVIVLTATPVLAVQAHGGAEGLISHQTGHILFVIGMGYLLLKLNNRKLKNHGWGEFTAFLWLIIAWNLTTFLGHWMNEFAPPEKFIKSNGKTISFLIESFPDALFYLTRLDHLLLLPSFVFLLLALRKWRVQA